MATVENSQGVWSRELLMAEKVLASAEQTCKPLQSYSGNDAICEVFATTCCSHGSKARSATALFYTYNCQIRCATRTHNVQCKETNCQKSFAKVKLTMYKGETELRHFDVDEENIIVIDDGLSIIDIQQDKMKQLLGGKMAFQLCPYDALKRIFPDCNDGTKTVEITLLGVAASDSARDDIRQPLQSSGPAVRNGRRLWTLSESKSGICGGAYTIGIYLLATHEGFCEPIEKGRKVRQGSIMTKEIACTIEKEINANRSMMGSRILDISATSVRDKPISTLDNPRSTIHCQKTGTSGHPNDPLQDGHKLHRSASGASSSNDVTVEIQERLSSPKKTSQSIDENVYVLPRHEPRGAFLERQFYKFRKYCTSTTKPDQP